MSGFPDHQRRCRRSIPLTAPGVSSGEGSVTSATAAVAQKAAKANLYVRLRPNGIAAPDETSKECIEA